MVERVGELKRRTAPGQCHIRPGREGRQLRRIMQKFAGTPFLPAAAAAIWRVIIGMSLAVEAPLALSVFSMEQGSELLALAREYFGPAATVVREPNVKRVIGDVMDGKAMVGVVPMPKTTDTTYWWTNLMEKGSNFPKIFSARCRSALPGTDGREAASALAIARLVPESSGDDISILVLEVDHNVSQSRLQAAFASAKLEAQWVSVVTLIPGTRHHLVEVRGFIHDHPDRSKLFLSRCSGRSARRCCASVSLALMPFPLTRRRIRPTSEIERYPLPRKNRPEV